MMFLMKNRVRTWNVGQIAENDNDVGIDMIFLIRQI